MATGTVPASFIGLKNKDHLGLGFGKNSDFIRVSDLRRIKLFRQTKVTVVKNSTSPGSETVELEPASAGSPLLGTFTSYSMLCFCCYFGRTVKDPLFSKIY